MRFLVEKENDSWVIMIEDMLGRRRYNKESYGSRQEAIDFLNWEFRNDDDIKNAIQ